MLNELKNEKLRLEKTDEFSDFKKENPQSYFYAAFSMYENIEDARWQFDYYDHDTGKVTSFELGDEIKLNTESKLFQKEKEDPKELNLDEIKIDLQEAFSIINNIKNDKYKNEHENKFIIVLQNINDKQVWNITYLTSEMHIINFKIDSTDGEIIEEKFDSLLRFKTN